MENKLWLPPALQLLASGITAGSLRTVDFASLVLVAYIMCVSCVSFGINSK